jgi:hypothetical protein
LALVACSHRPRPDGRTGIDFDIRLDETGLDALLSKLGSPTSSGEESARLAIWLLYALEHTSDDDRPPLPFTTQVRLTVLNGEHKQIATRLLQWGDNQWYQHLIPGIYTVTISINGTRGSADLASPPMTLTDGERLTATFSLRPPDENATPSR